MKIYTRIVIDMTTGAVVGESSFDYVGPVALCGGGSSKSPTIKPAPPAPEPQKAASSATATDADKARKQAAAAAGLAATKRTGSMGLTGSANTARKTLMGQ